MFNRYASSEVGVIATECSSGNLHIVVENIYIECVGEDGKPVPSGIQGKLLITDLHNRAMPLIRYDLGDAGILASSPCECGLPYPCLEKVIGRLSDILRLPDNRIVFPDDLAEIFYPLPVVNKFQVIQEETDKVRVILVLKTPGTDESLNTLIHRNLKTALGDEVEISLEFAEDIPILPSGKHRICISKLPT
ncbi:MAG: phenylacetate--CoA ligase family protein [Desulfobacteraceae bacterium]|nr:phenylacetate--CoA ligase family protein [Desulfobacteraceae bacterium]